MKTIILKNDITFEFLSYKIIIPNNSNIEYYFEGSLAKMIGDLPYFSIKSKDKKIISKFYWLGYVVYYFCLFYRSILPFVSDYPYDFKELSTIYGKNKIINFVIELKNNNYPKTDEQLKIIGEYKNGSNN